MRETQSEPRLLLPAAGLKALFNYDLRLWRFIVEHHAGKQIRSDACGDTSAKAEAQIEEQLALKGRG
jgi:hypothetical protein